MVNGLTEYRGFIGFYPSRHIISRRLRTARILLRNVMIGEENIGADIVHGDLLSPRGCTQFAEGLDVISCLAHCHAPVDSDLYQPNDALLNMVPVLNLLQAIRALKSKPHIVYFSSGGAMYRRKPEGIPFREADACEPSSSYGIQELAAEHHLRLAAERDHLTCTVLRAGNAYGTLLPEQRMQRLVGVAIHNVLHNRPVRFFGGLDNVRDYVQLDDICTIAEKVARPEAPFTVLNVGSGRGYSVRKVLGIIEDCAGLPMRIVADPNSQIGRWLTDWVVPDIAKAKGEVGWAPVVDFRAAIRAIVTAWNTEALSHATPAQ